ncbi:MAG: ABC transporter ATP-binding protein [Paraglaciecola sp.]|uniref:ABC transporter ATP-binding protein n=1 Tax=Paraglaciecola sp. TaxID=1920173 RepID=UPI0032982C7A
MSKSGSKLAFALRPSIPALIVAVILATVSSVAALGALWCIVQLIATHNYSLLVAASLLWAASALISGSASWISHNAEAKFSGRLRRMIANHFVRLPSSTLAKYKGEKLQQLMVGDISSLHHMVAHLPSELATFILVPVITIILLVSNADAMALLALIPGVVAALFYLLVIPRLAAKQGEARVNVMGNIIATVDDYSRGAAIFRIFTTQDGAMERYTKATQDFMQEIVERVRKVSSSVALATALLQAVSTFAIVYAIGYEWPTEKLAAALFFSLAIVTPALKLGHGLDYVTAGRSAANRLNDFLGQTKLPTGTTQVNSISNATLTLTNVIPSLSNTSRPKPINYKFQAGQVTAITGPSGIGKSTLLGLIAGNELLVSGAIFLGDVALNEMDEATRHKSIMLNPQNVGILTASIADNLALTAPNETDQSYKEALSVAELDKPLNTIASNLSGGEIQRINLARVFLSVAPVILLDEPTSALDDTTALKIFDALRHEAKVNHKTIIIVTHDLALAELADQVLSLNTSHSEENKR